MQNDSDSSKMLKRRAYLKKSIPLGSCPCGAFRAAAESIRASARPAVRPRCVPSSSLIDSYLKMMKMQSERKMRKQMRMRKRRKRKSHYQVVDSVRGSVHHSSRAVAAAAYAAHLAAVWHLSASAGRHAW